MSTPVLEVPPSYEGLEPLHLWHHFARLNRIPRPPGHEAEARSYVQEVAEKGGAEYRVDARGNLVVYLPAKEAPEQAPAVAVQSHLDMVCEKRPEVVHDFFRDPIHPRRQGDWIYGSGTTLGADNGIGAAACLSLITDPTVAHGPLELIFTVEEETGLHGASDLDGSLVSSRILINLDSEDPSGVTVGCAGGASVFCRLPASGATPVDGSVGRELRVAGLKGGHSGVQIHERLANAIKLLNGVLVSVRDAGIRFQLASIDGGSAHNAIPRDAVARLAIDSARVPTFNSFMDEMVQRLRSKWRDAEPGLAITHQEVPLMERLISQENSDALLDLLQRAPHGVLEMSPHFPDTVQSSANVASVRSKDGFVEVLISLRSLSQEKLEAQASDLRRLGTSLGGSATISDVYSGWEPDPDSQLLTLAKRQYQKTNGRPPEVQVIHAGLECGVIVSKLPGMDAISFGPLIQGAHSPDERVLATTVGPTWILLKRLLGVIAR
jgi:dipeptidase D